MMRRFFALLRARFRQHMALLPPVLGAGLLLLAGVALLGFAVASDRAGDDALRRVRIGIVGDTENDTWLRLGLYALENLDSSRFSLELEPMTEDEAVRLLRRGSLEAYAVFPDGFFTALERGDAIEPIRFVSSEAAAGIGSLLTGEIVRAISRLLLETENAIYGAQDYLSAYAPDVDPYAAGGALVEEYITLILDRESLFQEEVIGITGGLGFTESFLCAFMTLFLLFWGVACGPACLRRNTELGRLLKTSSLGSAAQILTEYLAYMALLLIVFALAIGLAAALVLLIPGLGEILALPEDALLRRSLRALFPAFMLGAGQLLLFELAEDAVSALLMQAFAAVGMGYVSGCFYPAGFFPDGLRRVGAALPSGVALRWISGEGTAAAPALYLVAFFLLLIALRELRLRGKET